MDRGPCGVSKPLPLHLVCTFREPGKGAEPSLPGLRLKALGPPQIREGWAPTCPSPERRRGQATLREWLLWAMVNVPVPTMGEGSKHTCLPYYMSCNPLAQDARDVVSPASGEETETQVAYQAKGL